MIIRLSLFSALLLLAACATGPKPEADKAPLALRPASFSTLDGWKKDNQQEALAAFAKSCARILKQAPDKTFGPAGAGGGTYAAWQAACRALPPLPASAAAARAYFETWFTPWQASAAGNEEGLFTGYYEASLRGALTRHGPYQTALRVRPADLVLVDLGEFRDELKGQRIAGRVVGGQLKPFEDRAAIEAGKLPHDEDLTLLWVDDAVDAFFLHIQGSGIVTMADGSAVRIGYDAQNGHPYYAVGRELIKRGELQKDDVSMQSIRAWLAAHPEQAAGLMNTNKSYVFFRRLTGDGPLGGEGVALTPERSLAVDRKHIPYGVPVWLETKDDSDTAKLARLMVAQDTGGAIIGPVRGDVFWGYGPAAEERAGAMKAKGRYWLLLPKNAAPAR